MVESGHARDRDREEGRARGPGGPGGARAAPGEDELVVASRPPASTTATSTSARAAAPTPRRTPVDRRRRGRGHRARGSRRARRLGGGAGQLRRARGRRRATGGAGAGRRRRPSRRRGAAAGHDRALPRATTPTRCGRATTCSCTRRPAASGLLLTQMVKQRGGRVIATTSTEEKAELARGAGADEVIGYDGLRGARARAHGRRGRARRLRRDRPDDVRGRPRGAAPARLHGRSTARPAAARTRSTCRACASGSRCTSRGRACRRTSPRAGAAAARAGEVLELGRRRLARRADRRALPARRRPGGPTRTSRRAARPESCCCCPDPSRTGLRRLLFDPFQKVDRLRIMPTASELERMLREAALRVTRPRMAVLDRGARPSARRHRLDHRRRARGLGDVSHQAVYDVLRALTDAGPGAADPAAGLAWRATRRGSATTTTTSSAGRAARSPTSTAPSAQRPA